MTAQDLPPEFLEFLSSISSKRPRTVIEHILKHGYITTEELKERYGYNHPPRAARDVREQGVPLVSFRVVGNDGRKIAAYRFGDPAGVRWDRLGGRKNIPKRIKKELVTINGPQCAICLEEYAASYLQVDHRIPYQVSGQQSAARRVNDYMLLCGSCNRAKSWVCEHCENGQTRKSLEVCASCYWAYPDSYEHVAMRSIRRLEIVWSQDEVLTFDELKRRAELSEETLQQYIKAVLARHLGIRQHTNDRQDQP
jgi:hypothetical protein